jgi:hypothetical protein
MQQSGNPASRNTTSNAGVIPTKVPVPVSGKAMGTMPSTGNGHQPGSGVKGFSDGGLLPGKV